MEYLQLFNENGEMLVGEKIARKDKNQVGSGRYFMIILLFLENDNSEILIQLTSKEKGSVYATTGGHVTFGDDGLKTVIKESQEELNLDLTPEDVEYVGLVRGKSVLAEVYYTKQNIDLNNLKLQEEEVESISWMSVEEIDKLIDEGKFRSSNIPAFKEVMDYKKRKKCNF